MWYMQELVRELPVCHDPSQDMENEHFKTREVRGNNRHRLMCENAQHGGEWLLRLVNLVFPPWVIMNTPAVLPEPVPDQPLPV